MLRLALFFLVVSLVAALFGFTGIAVAAAGIARILFFIFLVVFLALLIAGLMIHSGYGLVKASGRIFLEAAPQGIDPDAIGRSLVSEHGVIEVHDLHVWEITSGFSALSAHVLVGTDNDCHAPRRRLEARLHEHFNIEHTTRQVDHQGGELLEIEFPGQHERSTR